MFYIASLFDEILWMLFYSNLEQRACGVRYWLWIGRVEAAGA